nr:DNA-directed DNA polymerase [Tanacetum cinerariifolium]
MQHSHSNDDTHFCMDVIDEVTEEELDAMLDDSKPFSTTSEKISESFLEHEFKEFMAIKIEEIPQQEKEVEDKFEELPLEENLRIKNSIQDPPTGLVMKPLSKHLEYAFLEKESLLRVVITALLKDDTKQLVFVLKKHKKRLLGKHPTFWALAHLFANTKSASRTTLNLLFKERLAGNKFFCFLDGFSGYFHIPIESADQEKTTFICPYGTYAYKRMPFGLCNAPATFHRCMVAIFQDMLKTSMEVFMDDFLVFGDSFDSCLQDAKPHLICWILLLQGFDIEIKNKKGAENVVADHLSQLENPHQEELRVGDIDNNFPHETLMNVSSTEENKVPWFTDFANYLVGKILRKGLTYAQRCKFFSKLKHYFWDEPYLFKMCPDEMIRICVYRAKT